MGWKEPNKPPQYTQEGDEWLPQERRRNRAWRGAVPSWWHPPLAGLYLSDLLQAHSGKHLVSVCACIDACACAFCVCVWGVLWRVCVCVVSVCGGGKVSLWCATMSTESLPALPRGVPVLLQSLVSDPVTEQLGQSHLKGVSFSNRSTPLA